MGNLPKNRRPQSSKPSAGVAQASKPREPKGENGTFYARCIKCKGKKEMTEVYKDQFSNGTKVLKGKCTSCQSTLNLIVKKEVWEAFQ